jgi:uncharacterized membrane protein (UPF0127 family)
MDYPAMNPEAYHMRRRSTRLLQAVLLAAIVSTYLGCNRSNPEPSDHASEREIPFRVDGHLQILRGNETLAQLEIEIADNDSSRTRGLMQRTEMSDDRGMLFIFPNEEDRAFWMANTPLSLDLIFIDADSTIMHIARYMRPLSSQDVPSDGPAQFVLEMIAGSADTIGIVEGDRVTWSRVDGE